MRPSCIADVLGVGSTTAVTSLMAQYGVGPSSSISYSQAEIGDSGEPGQSVIQDMDSRVRFDPATGSEVPKTGCYY